VHDQQQSVSNPRDLAGTASSTSSGSVFKHAGCEERHERNWRLVALSVIKYSQVRTEAYAAYVHTRNQKAYHSIVYPLEQEFIAELKAALRSDVNSREIAQRFGLVDF
jgi:hypothetical protein